MQAVGSDLVSSLENRVCECCSPLNQLLNYNLVMNLTDTTSMSELSVLIVPLR